MPSFLYGLSVYGASSADLNNVQHFLDRGYKRRYILRKLNIRDLLERSDCRTFGKATNSPLVKILPKRNFTNYALRKPCFYHPIMATERFKSFCVNGLTFSYYINSLMQKEPSVHIRPYVHVQLKYYGKIIHLLSPEKAFFHH